MNPLELLFNFINQLNAIKQRSQPLADILSLPSLQEQLQGQNLYNDLGQRYMPGYYGEGTNPWVDRTGQAVEDQSNLIMNQAPVPQIRMPSFRSRFISTTTRPQPTTIPIPTRSQVPPIGPVLPSIINPLIQKYFPQNQWVNAQRVMMGESGGRPGAIGDQYPIRGLLAPSYGLFQIRGLPGRPAPQQLLNPEFNVQYAANMQRQQGWNPWSVARKLGIK